MQISRYSSFALSWENNGNWCISGVKLLMRHKNTRFFSLPRVLLFLWTDKCMASGVPKHKCSSLRWSLAIPVRNNKFIEIRGIGGTYKEHKEKSTAQINQQLKMRCEIIFIECDTKQAHYPICFQHSVCWVPAVVLPDHVWRQFLPACTELFWNGSSVLCLNLISISWIYQGSIIGFPILENAKYFRQGIT